jgi:hypothetical protein
MRVIVRPSQGTAATLVETQRPHPSHLNLANRWFRLYPAIISASFGVVAFWYDRTFNVFTEQATKRSAMHRLTALISFILAFCVSPIAIGQPTLSAPTDLSAPGTQSVGLSIAISSDGTRATALWRETAANRKKQVKTSSATIVGGVASWGPITTLSPANNDADDATIQISADGTQAVAIWQSEDSSLKVFVVESSSATVVGNAASWGSATRLSSTSASGNRPRIALSADGTRAFAVWERYPPASSRSTCRVVVGRPSIISGTTSSWGSVQQISEQGGCCEEPELDISSSTGTGVTTVWSKLYPGGTSIVRTRTGTANGTTVSWGSITDLSAPGFQSRNSVVAVSADGSKATAVWARARVDSTGRALSPILVRSRSATITGNLADWGATTVLSSPTGTSGQPLIGVSSDGATAHSSWIRRDGATYAIESSSASVAGNVASWSSPTSVSGNGGAIRGHSLSISPDGSKGLSTWTRVVSSKLVAQGSSGVLSAGSQLWGSVFDISSTAQPAAGSCGAFSSDGSIGLVAWLQNNGAGKYFAQASVAEFVHPTPTPTPLATNTPTSTPTPAPTTTPVGQLSGVAPVPSSSSIDHYVVLRVKDYPTNFRRDYYGYLLRASDHKLVKMGKFKIRNNRGRLEFHDVPPGEYRTFTVVIRTRAPKVISSRQRTITVK